jgi:hypothetical protein
MIALAAADAQGVRVRRRVDTTSETAITIRGSSLARYA